MAGSSSRSLAFSVSALLLCLSACKNQAPPAAEAAEPTASPKTEAPPAASAATAAAPPPAPAAADTAAAAPAANKYSEANFDLTLAPKGSYASGQAGEAEIVLAAKAPF